MFSQDTLQIKTKTYYIPHTDSSEVDAQLLLIIHLVHLRSTYRVN